MCYITAVTLVKLYQLSVLACSKDVLQHNQVRRETTHLAEPSPYINPATARRGLKSHTVQLPLTVSCLPFMHRSPL